MHLPANTLARIALQSSDYIYTFEIPAQTTREIAVPEQTHAVEFFSGMPRTVPFLGDQFCGYSHEALSGEIIVESWIEYRRWQRAARSADIHTKPAVISTVRS